MIQKVTRYQTNDGKLCVSKEEAEAHIVTTLENSIGPIIDSVNAGLRPDRYICTSAKLALVKALVGTPETARQLQLELSKVLS